MPEAGSNLQPCAPQPSTLTAQVTSARQGLLHYDQIIALNGRAADGRLRYPNYENMYYLSFCFYFIDTNKLTLQAITIEVISEQINQKHAKYKQLVN